MFSDWVMIFLSLFSWSPYSVMHLMTRSKDTMAVTCGMITRNKYVAILLLTANTINSHWLINCSPAPLLWCCILERLFSNSWQRWSSPVLLQSIWDFCNWMQLIQNWPWWEDCWPILLHHCKHFQATLSYVYYVAEILVKFLINFGDLGQFSIDHQIRTRQFNQMHGHIILCIQIAKFNLHGDITANGELLVEIEKVAIPDA